MASGQLHLTDTDFAESVLSFLRNTAFNFYKVGHFSPVLTFSSAQFEITKVKKFTTANVLFGVSSVQQLQGKLSGVSARDLFTLFANRNIDFSFATYNYNENEMFKLLAKGVLQKLGTVILDKHQFSNPNEDKMYCPSKSKPKPPSDIAFDMDWLGIGNPSTWHGYPDARFRIKNNDTLMLAHNDLEEGTPGNSLLLEAKNDERLMQLVATTVVASFTEKNLHKDLDDIIPTVMIMPTSAIICVYDVTQDYLMISDKFEWLAKDEDDNYIFNKPGFILLWMALNHREFLCKIKTNLDILRSTIKEKLVMYDKYKEFETLVDKRNRFLKMGHGNITHECGEAVDLTCEPQSKKSKAASS